MTQLLEIERELSGPDAEEVMQQYDQVLLRLDERIATVLREGLPREEYEKAEQLKEAVLVSRKLLRLAVRDGQGAVVEK